MTPLPPVRRRASYADIGADDLVFALFHDRIMGDPDALTPEDEGGELAKSARSSYHTAYTAARESGASVDAARAAGRAAARERREERVP